eukprot:jgi/Chrzof1/3120/Cz12g12210.t1
MKAVVLGGTGAIGTELVGQLATSGAWSTVTTVGRREVQLPDRYKDTKAQLVQKTINMDNMETEAATAFEGADAVFCALGTTRKDAGSAKQFKKVDYEYVARSAALAKSSGVKYYGLVSATGANPHVWASDMALFHPLLYTKTKGLAEEAVKAQNFERTAIFRPGMLDRGDEARAVEQVFSLVIGSIKVSDVARVIVADAERSFKEGIKGLSVYEMKDLKAYLTCGKLLP